MDLNKLEHEVAIWALKNFGHGPPDNCLLGIVEEVGELAHYVLKQKQKIRTDEDHIQGQIDAIGDIVIYLADFCARSGYNFGPIVERTWRKVSMRDWIKNPIDGKKKKKTSRK